MVNCFIGWYTAVGIGQVIIYLVWMALTHCCCRSMRQITRASFKSLKIYSCICGHRVDTPCMDGSVSEAALYRFCGGKSRDFL